MPKKTKLKNSLGVIKYCFLVKNNIFAKCLTSKYLVYESLKVSFFSVVNLCQHWLQ